MESFDPQRQQSAKAFHDNRSQLFQRSGKRRKPVSNTANEAASIQQSLNRTQYLLKNELERVSQVASAIEDDGKILEETYNQQQSLDVHKAKKALTGLQRAQQKERRVLMASIIFFWTVVFYILWSRIILNVPFVERIILAIKSQILKLF